MLSEVDIFFDTTVLVAASEQSHPHFAQARPALVRVAAGQDKGFLGQHSIAAMFAAPTRLPVQPRIHPVEAVRIVTDNILPHFEVVATVLQDYREALTMLHQRVHPFMDFTAYTEETSRRTAGWGGREKLTTSDNR